MNTLSIKVIHFSRWSGPNTVFAWVGDVPFSVKIMFQEKIKSPFLCVIKCKKLFW